ncbi:MAG: SAM-dependent chlorinase/fluorinase [Candidatus Caldarchaeum sp.]
MVKNLKKPVVALLTDYGTRDTYVAEVKAVILKHRADAVIVDITHEIDPFNVLEGAFLLMLAAKSFPDNTVFLAVVDPTVGGHRDAIAVKTARGKMFIGPDTGLLYPAVSAEGISKIYRIVVEKIPSVSPTFHGRDVFAEFAGLFIAGKNWLRFVEEKKQMNELGIPKPKLGENSVEATALHVDRFGNIILNIQGTLPESWKTVDIKAADSSFDKVKVVSYYSQASEGELVLLVGGTGYLEIAVNRGNAAKALAIRPGERLLISKSRF